MSIIATDQVKSAQQSTETKATYRYVREADGIYRQQTSRYLHERPTINGKRTWRSLETKNLKLAKEEFRRRRSAEDRGEDPYTEKREPPAESEKAEVPSVVGDALRRYVQDNCPDRNRKKRPERTLADEKTNVKILLPFWDEVAPDDITIALCDKYHDKRVEKVSRGEGDRTVDLELNTLRNALLWGCRCELLKHMPLPAGWPRYHTGDAVHHCRE